MNYRENRPWGSFENILDIATAKVKVITISPGQSPSYQFHNKRSEVWVIVQGTGELTLNENKSIVTEQSIVRVEMGDRHCIRNIGTHDLMFVEVQLGSYFGEDDIVRLTDDYGRV